MRDAPEDKSALEFSWGVIALGESGRARTADLILRGKLKGEPGSWK
jgi:hypothetical protein